MNFSELSERKILYDNGQVKIRGFFQNNGRREGKREEWYINGQIRLEEFYRNGKLDGERKAWHENGQLNIHEFYKKDSRDGPRKIWHDNGQLFMSEFWKNGYISGERREYYANGALAEREFWRNGVQGRDKIWCRDGSLYSCLVFKDGKAEIKYQYLQPIHEIELDWIQFITPKSSYDFSFRKQQTLLRLRSKLYSRAKLKKYKIFNLFLVTDLLMFGIKFI